MADHLNFYESIDEARFRLENTVVVYDGEPCYIHKVHMPPAEGVKADGILRLSISILPNNINQYNGRDVEEDDTGVRGPRIVRKKINSPKFNKFRPFRMGFCNFMKEGEQARYLSRIPGRRSKQGLASDTLNVTVISRDTYKPNLEHLISDSSFRDMIQGTFPSLPECLDNLDDGRLIGVDYEYAVGRDSLGLDYLYHKTEKVGLVRPDQILLSQKKSYLRESIIEAVNLPNNIVGL